jgi:hypothetical protein
MHWGNDLVTVASMLIGTVAGYYIIVAALRVTRSGSRRRRGTPPAGIRD